MKQIAPWEAEGKVMVGMDSKSGTVEEGMGGAEEIVPLQNQWKRC